MNNCLSGTMSLGANLLSIFVPSYFLTVTKKCDSTALTTYFYIVRAVLSQTYPLFFPYLMGAVSVLKTDIKGGGLPHFTREKRVDLRQAFPPIYI